MSARGSAEPGPACPICGRPAVAEFRPFCSQRCADVDLGRWLNERYVIPEAVDPDAPPPPVPDARAGRRDPSRAKLGEAGQGPAH